MDLTETVAALEAEIAANRRLRKALIRHKELIDYLNLFGVVVPSASRIPELTIDLRGVGETDFLVITSRVAAAQSGPAVHGQGVDSLGPFEFFEYTLENPKCFLTVYH